MNKKQTVLEYGMVFLVLMVMAWGAFVVDKANAGRLYNLISNKSTGSTTGTALSVDGHYKDWTFQAVCTGNPNLSSPMSTIYIYGSLDGTTYRAIDTFTWQTNQMGSGTSHYMWHLADKPIKNILGVWTTVGWNTVGSCNLYGLGVN